MSTDVLVEVLSKLAEVTGYGSYRLARCLGVSVDTVKSIISGRRQPGPKVAEGLAALANHILDAPNRYRPEVVEWAEITLDIL